MKKAKKERKRCKRHPEKFLVRKCFRCKREICSSCAKKKFKHFFCSNKCSYLYLLDNFKKSLRKKKIYKDPLSYPLLRVLFFMFFFLFVISIYLLYKKPTIEMKEYFIKKILVKEKEVRHFYDGSIKRFNTDKKEIYLTFDGGNYAQRAEVILDVLKENNIKASFFLTGEFIKKFPEIVKRIIRDSHEVLNHTYSHPHLTTYEINGRNFTRKDITPEKVFGELFRTEEIYEKLTGRKMDYIWRAPYGEENKEIIRWASRMGYIHIRWSFDFLDWRSVEDYKKRLKEFFKIRDKRGYILLLHLGSPENDTADYRVFLSHLIKELKNQKYEFKKISEGLRKVYY